MANKQDIQVNNQWNWAKWSSAIAIIVAGLLANYYYMQQPWPLRLLGWMLLLAVAGTIMLQTWQGKQLRNFAYESRSEIRKVVWPTRQETMQTTLLIAAMVVILALILWSVDGFLLWAIGWLTGQRG
jgi:preprotein translocase subunit SecE